MEYRKIINFGNSSFVVSLPKSWVLHNKLQKGDAIALEQNGTNQIILFPKGVEEKAKEFKTVTINVNGKSVHEIKREIVTAYLDNHSSIAITGDNLSPLSEGIRDIITDLAAVEIMEQTSKKVMVRDFLDMNTVVLSDIVRKIDLIIRAMLTDARENLNYPSAGHKNISNRDKDVNRLTFLATRIIRHYLEHPYYQKKINMSPVQIFEAYNVIQKLEGIGDAIKRLSRFIEKNLARLHKDKALKTDIKDMMQSIYTFYVDSMKAYYKRDRSIANAIANRRVELTKIYDECCRKHLDKASLVPLVENFYALINITRSLLRISYQISEEKN